MINKPFVVSVVGLDYAIKDDMKEIPIPKYNNKVPNQAMFDDDTTAYIPMDALSAPTMNGREERAHYW